MKFDKEKISHFAFFAVRSLLLFCADERDDGKKGRKVDDDDECALSRSCVWVSSAVAAAAAAQNSRRALSTAETFAAPFGWYFNWKIIENVQHFSTSRNFYMNNHGMEMAVQTRDLVYPWQHVMCTISSKEARKKSSSKTLSLARRLENWVFGSGRRKSYRAAEWNFSSLLLTISKLNSNKLRTKKLLVASAVAACST